MVNGLEQIVQDATNPNFLITLFFSYNNNVYFKLVYRLNFNYMYCPINQCLKYQRFTGCRIRKFEFVAKSQILRMDWEETNNLVRVS